MNTVPINFSSKYEEANINVTVLQVSSDPNTDEIYVYENEESDDVSSYLAANMTKLEIHRRIAHLSVPSLQKINCPDCMITKGGTQGYNAERVEEQKIPIPLKRLNTDFYGPIRPMSIRGMKMILVFICDAIAHVWCIPIRHRDE